MYYLLPKMNCHNVISIVLLLTVLMMASARAAFAAGANIAVNPAAKNVTVNEVFPVDIVIDGAGRPFVGAQATVGISSNLVVQELTLGDCNFAFVTTPATSNPSFAGAILGGQSTKCTVATIKLKAQSAGNASITFKNVVIGAKDTTNQMLDFIQNGAYVVSATPNTQTIKVTPLPQTTLPPNYAPLPVRAIRDLTNSNQLLQPDNNASSAGGAKPVVNQLSQYTLRIRVTDQLGQSLVGALVRLFSQPQTSTTNHDGSVEFLHVEPGVHHIVVEHQNKQIAEETINVTGNSAVLAFTVKQAVVKTPAPEPQKGTNPAGKPQFMWIALLLLLTIICLIIALRKRFMRLIRKQPPLPPTDIKQGA